MFLIWYLAMAVISSLEIRGINIMLNKPSIQSGTYDIYKSSYANDGNRTGLPTMSAYVLDPYWQGDLQGFYTVTSITVTNADIDYWINFEKNAFIGVSVIDVRCSKDNVTICGQWPGSSPRGTTKVFHCAHTGPVRFVRIWREGHESISLGEVEIEGEPSNSTGSRGKAMYVKIMHQKILTPTMSLSARSEISCGVMCDQTELCLAFSYSSSEQSNCLLATDVTMTSDLMWRSYKLSPCY